MENFKWYNHLGFNKFYYRYTDDSTFFISRDNSAILESLREKTLDIVSLIELLSTGYCFGDRTLVNEVSRTPWMAKPSEKLNEWNYFEVPMHDEKKISTEEIVETFYQLLKVELWEYIKPHQNIGVLLTGGMDSRIVACILNDLVTENKSYNKNIFTFTWGFTRSRDVVYAEKISRHFGWNWEHLMVDEEQMSDNIEQTIKEGCEFTPVHLHAMPKVAKKNYLDCVLAGSFGDSVGRGEYSGFKVGRLKSLNSKVKNFSFLFNSSSVNYYKRYVNEDISRYHDLFPRDKEYHYHEQDMQIHYMRRMLNSCMNVIDKRIPVYQSFTHPDVFGFIWSLDRSIRTDNIYLALLKKYGSELLTIPWARTGLLYPEKEGTPDGYSKKHHDYGKMIRESFFPSILDDIKKYELDEFQIFNVAGIRDLIKYCTNYPIEGSIYYEERLLWIACLTKYLRINEIKNEVILRGSEFDRMLTAGEYFSKYLYRKIKK